jgi:hypothetical protein
MTEGENMPAAPGSLAANRPVVGAPSEIGASDTLALIRRVGASWALETNSMRRAVSGGSSHTRTRFAAGDPFG